MVLLLALLTPNPMIPTTLYYALVGTWLALLALDVILRATSND